MKISELGFFIDTEIRRQFKSRRKFAIKTNRSYTYFNKMISGMINQNQSIGLNAATEILSDLGYELVIKKKS
ncbi:hypothetical protein H3N56_10365 [Cetobacterium sp. 2A]|uniref:hypothetical protein n=1 Tax=Cetobacterium sp. 2A TaxID=2754723 RepID=UPI00163D254F|nr:hypothetical protein [Cetobacterium sp. 2A]MBC2855319.1 hypothetical protein [Cetobacterium sp. 2A]MBC2856803.1 hypothetical protein [Cetobacterium sp. 2A]MBC2856844.1 hypothetical protein [Cetobacterium sp. 2A]